MNTQATKHALAEDIKREVLMDLQHSQSPNIFNYALGSKQTYADRNSFDRNMIDSIKRDVLKEMESSQYGQNPSSYRAMIEAVKRDILASIHTDLPINPGGFGGTYQPDRALIEAVKRDVLAHIESQQDALAGSFAPYQVRQNGYYAMPNQSVIQAVKNSVLAEMQMPEN